MNEINRLQHLAGILTEIKVNNPIDYNKIFDECWEQAIDDIGEYDYEDDEDELSNEDEVSEYANDLFKDKTGKDRIDTMKEDVSGFNIGQTKQSDGHKSTVVDVNPETQSVTWDIKKDITDKEIHDDLSKIIRKFETVQVKDFHSRPKLIQLIKDLKTIRNKFSRTVVKEERNKLINKLGSLLNEIKINKPIRDKRDVVDLYLKKYLDIKQDDVDEFWKIVEDKGIDITDYISDDDYDPFPEYNQFFHNKLIQYLNNNG